MKNIVYRFTLKVKIKIFQDTSPFEKKNSKDTYLFSFVGSKITVYIEESTTVKQTQNFFLDVRLR